MKITLKAARVNAELTQTDAAKALGISKGTILSYETYKTSPSVEMAERFAALYGLPVSSIKFFSE